MLVGETELEVLRDIRELLMLLAEPQLEQRDKLRREEIRKIAGGGRRNIRAIVLMNGALTRAEIAREAPIDPSQLTKLVKSLEAARLLRTDNKNPEIVVPLTEASFLG